MNPEEHLNSIFSQLPPELQQDLINYAEALLGKEGHQEEPVQRPRFYICPVCFLASDTQQACHGQLMMPCNAERKEDCKPLVDNRGNIKSRAPRWFVASINAEKDQ